MPELLETTNRTNTRYKKGFGFFNVLCRVGILHRSNREAAAAVLSLPDDPVPRFSAQQGISEGGGPVELAGFGGGFIFSHDFKPVFLARFILGFHDSSQPGEVGLALGKVVQSSGGLYLIHRAWEPRLTDLDNSADTTEAGGHPNRKASGYGPESRP